MRLKKGTVGYRYGIPGAVRTGITLNVSSTQPYWLKLHSAGTSERWWSGWDRRCDTVASKWFRSCYSGVRKCHNAASKCGVCRLIGKTDITDAHSSLSHSLMFSVPQAAHFTLRPQHEWGFFFQDHLNDYIPHICHCPKIKCADPDQQRMYLLMRSVKQRGSSRRVLPPSVKTEWVVNGLCLCSTFLV